MEEEQEILIEEKASLYVEYTGKFDKASALKTTAAWVLGGPVLGAVVEDMEIKKRKPIFSAHELKDVLTGDFVWLEGREQNGKLILTDNHLVLHYQTGFFKKVDHVAAVPLQFIKSVEKAKMGSFRKHLLMKCEVPTKEKLLRFDLRIFVKNKEQ